MRIRSPRQVGMMGLGRMRSNMVRRLQRAGDDCVVYDVAPQAVQALTRDVATRSISVGDLAPHLERGDVLGDGGNSCCVDDLRRAADADRVLSAMRFAFGGHLERK